MKNTLVLGASTNESRFSYKAVYLLRRHGHPVVAVGRQTGTVADVEIVPQIPADLQVDTVTLYLNPTHQQQYEAAILNLRPKRVIFNPGTENPPFEQKLRQAGIEVQEHCTLIMLNAGEF